MDDIKKYAQQCEDAAFEACMAFHEHPTLYNKLRARDAMAANAHALELYAEVGGSWRDLARDAIRRYREQGEAGA